jgi:hypothetical protein
MINFKKYLYEGKEQEGSTFTHNGNLYDLPKLIEIIKDNPIKEIKVSDLDWIFEFDNPLMDDPQRIKTADIKVPIIVIKFYSKLVVLDGLHRLAKAKLNELKTLPGRYVTKEQLSECRIKDQ